MFFLILNLHVQRGNFDSSVPVLLFCPSVSLPLPLSFPHSFPERLVHRHLSAELNKCILHHYMNDCTVDMTVWDTHIHTQSRSCQIQDQIYTFFIKKVSLRINLEEASHGMLIQLQIQTNGGYTFETSQTPWKPFNFRFVFASVRARVCEIICLRTNSVCQIDIKATRVFQMPDLSDSNIL